jgi:hydroxymethylglutaryl-CoA reductase
MKEAPGATTSGSGRLVGPEAGMKEAPGATTSGSGRLVGLEAGMKEAPGATTSGSGRLVGPEAGMKEVPGATTSGFGHGKVILLGEHAVVHGQPALAAGIRVGVRAHAGPGDGTIHIPAWGVESLPGDDSPVRLALVSVAEKLGADLRSLDLWLEAEVPARAGLGSSAAMAVAVARALAGRTGAGEAAVMAAVDAAEKVFHGSPSGIDAAVAGRRGVGRFDKSAGWQPLAMPRPIELCVGLTGKPRQTATLVAAVGRLCDDLPVAGRLIDTMGDVARAGCDAVAAGEVTALGRLFNLAHGLLVGIGVSTPELDGMVHAARSAGALGAKLTGAGGGGAVIAIGPERHEEILRAWRGLGRYGFVTAIEHDEHAHAPTSMTSTPPIPQA